MLKSIGKNNFLCSDDGVVPGGLFKCFLRQFDMGSFAFNQNDRFGFLRDQKVNSLCQSV